MTVGRSPVPAKRPELSTGPASADITASAPRTVEGQRLDALIAYWELLSNLVSRDLRTRYRGSILGIFWSLLNPLMLMLVYTVVFSVIARINIPRYPVFLLAGLVPWNAFAQTLTTATMSVMDNAGPVRKIYFPHEVLPLSAVLSTSVHLLISLVLLAVLSIVFGVGIGLSILFLPLLVILQIIFTAGIGSLLAGAQVYFRDVQYFLTVLITVWFFATPIVYPLALVPPRLRPLFEVNPMAWLISSYQDVWYYHRTPGWHFLAFAVIALVVGWIGLVAFRRMSRGFAEEV